MRESEQYGEQVRKKQNASVNKAKKFESSISNGRKIFRLLLFLNEMAEFNELIKSKSDFNMRFLKITSVCCSFIYPYLNKKLKWK
jgi:hypothetical protein